MCVCVCMCVYRCKHMVVNMYMKVKILNLEISLKVCLHTFDMFFTNKCRILL